MLHVFVKTIHVRGVQPVDQGITGGQIGTVVFLLAAEPLAPGLQCDPKVAAHDVVGGIRLGICHKIAVAQGLQ